MILHWNADRIGTWSQQQRRWREHSVLRTFTKTLWAQLWTSSKSILQAPLWTRSWPLTRSWRTRTPISTIKRRPTTRWWLTSITMLITTSSSEMSTRDQSPSVIKEQLTPHTSLWLASLVWLPNKTTNHIIWYNYQGHTIENEVSTQEC